MNGQQLPVVLWLAGLSWQIGLAYLIDLVVGDPRGIPHPVIIIGKGIDAAEKLLRRIITSLLGLRFSGVILTLVIVGLTYFVTWGLVQVTSQLNQWLGWVVSVWFLSTTLAVKCLRQAADEIYQLLEDGQLQTARQKVGWIVGRDTDRLDEPEIVRATVETVAENIVDGIVAPLFYAFIGGLPLAMAYKAVNTLDSMVGYKNEKYREFGWFAARLDDIANYIPARITGILMLIAAAAAGKDAGYAVHTWRRDAGKHPSPNSGIPESIVAGALGIRLGGLNFYGGRESFRPYMGKPMDELNRRHIKETTRIMLITSLLAVTTGVLITLAVK
ncbi:MAG: adenosylcobinamide-phosphate synthase CbiB [Bacillota bacterium]